MGALVTALGFEALVCGAALWVAHRLNRPR